MNKQGLEQFFKNKKVLVTGGAGFVGSHVVESLTRMGAQVSVPYRSTTKFDFLKNIKNEIQLIECDLFDRERTFKITKLGLMMTGAGFIILGLLMLFQVLRFR